MLSNITYTVHNVKFTDGSVVKKLVYNNYYNYNNYYKLQKSYGYNVEMYSEFQKYK